MAKPDMRADVLLIAFSFARLKCNFLHDSNVAAEYCPSVLMLYCKILKLNIIIIDDNICTTTLIILITGYICQQNLKNAPSKKWNKI